ncbi:MAG: BACON domain-containing protein, partial [Solirubrobacterales bacterium]
MTVTVTQAGATPTLSVTPSNQAVTFAAGSTAFNVTSNTTWSAGSDQTWCTVTPSGSGNGSITVNYTENITYVTRVANVTVTVSGQSPVVVTVTQAGGTPPEFLYTIENDVQTSDRTLEFDLYIKDNDASQPIELANIQAGVTLNPGIYNGGTITLAIVSGSSQLVAAQQPTSVIWVQSQNCIKVTPKAPPGPGAGTILSTTSPGTRVCRLRLTNTVAFTASSTANLAFSFTTVPYPTKAFQYIGTVNTAMPCSATNCYSNATNILLNAPSKVLNLSSVLLEGLYSGSGTMRAAADENGSHWGPTIADKIAVELHNNSNYASVMYTAANVELSTNGLATLNIPSTYSGNYYITIKHRNSIETVSALPVSFSGSTISYAFDNSTKAYGNNMLLMIDGRWVIYCGDVNQDGLVDAGDMAPVDNLSAQAAAGYVVEDANGDGLVDAGDMAILDNNSA